MLLLAFVFPSTRLFYYWQHKLNICKLPGAVLVLMCFCCLCKYQGVDMENIVRVSHYLIASHHLGTNIGIHKNARLCAHGLTWKFYLRVTNTILACSVAHQEMWKRHCFICFRAMQIYCIWCILVMCSLKSVSQSQTGMSPFNCARYPFLLKIKCCRKLGT